MPVPFQPRWTIKATPDVTTRNRVEMKLLIAIPALNEEASIENIIQRSLQARDHVCRHSSVSDVGIRVVSDGSTGGTAEIASQYSDQIDRIIFPHICFKK
jgi:glycosyltransferase involved in cell wall biosynthesis